MIRNRTNCFVTELYRLFTKKEAYLGMAGVALALFLSVGSWEDITDSVVYTMMLSTYNTGFLLAFVFCALPYGSVFCDDLEHHYIRYAVNRGGLWKYVTAKMAVIFLSSVWTMAAGCILFALACSLKLPWLEEQTIRNVLFGGSYVGLLENGNYIGWAGLYGMQWGLFGGCLSLMSSYLSLFLSNKLFVLAMPVLLYQIIVEVGTNTFRKYSMLDPLLIFDGRYKLFSSDGAVLLWACAVGLCCYVIFCIAVYRKLKKRM